MPLSMLNKGESNNIKRIVGKNDTIQFLASLGFVTGSPVTVINKLGSNVIVNIKDSRIAISKELANRIMV